MKQLLFIFASMFFVFSCTQEESSQIPENSNTDIQTTVLTTAEAQIRFAKLLSKAASNSVEVRKFLKDEAIRQFDNDYDVFYPMVKNKIVAEGQSFRDILLSYCNNDKELEEVEQSQLLLNILVPDLTLFWEFNAEIWDTNDQEIVVMCRNDESDTMYENGEAIGQMSKGDIPGFPCLIVKNNERLKVKSVNTRSGEAVYEFAHEAFDGSKTVQTRKGSDIPLQETEDLSKGLRPSDFKSDVIKAWNEFKNVREACQRDYIYYGITKSNKPGTLNRNIREKLYRFRIQPNAFSKIADQKEKDPQLQIAEKKKGYLTNEEIIKKIWNDGKFDIRFKSYIATDETGKAMEHELVFSVDPRDLFSIEKVHLVHKNRTLFRHSKNTYSVNPQYLRSKWYYPANHIGTNNYVFELPWDLYSKALSIHLFAEEHDDDQIIKSSRTVVNEFTSKTDFSLEGGGEVSGIKLATKLGYGISSTTSTSSTAEVTTTTGSDNLGTLSFFYYDPIIQYQNSDGTYKVYSVFNGTVEATLLPHDLSKY